MIPQGNRPMARLLATSLMGAALLCTPLTGAAEQTRVDLAATSKDDLLMFWEERELYVQTATRSEKPITQVAENMTVITAKEIEVMNANSVAEVLARVPGLFVDFSTNDYVSPAQLYIQGSETRHVKVLLDGMPVNFLSEGNSETSFIPLRIVERIEIIKGAASSTWGSALGGVVNIITRNTGDHTIPNGMLSGSWGEANSRDLGADLRGNNGPIGYYLYAGQQASDGLRNDRDYSRNSVFGKLLLTPSRNLDITLSGGFSNPEQNSGNLETRIGAVQNKTLLRSQFLNGNIEYRATPELTVRGGLYLYKSNLDLPINFVSDGTLFIQSVNNEQAVGGNVQATWSSGIQTLTAGIEASHGSMDETTNAGPILQAPPANYPATIAASPTVDRWGIFANDTLEFGPLAVTPGIRLDHDNITGYFISPNLGVTWELGEHTVARASAARGFTSPPLAYSKGQGPSFLANPDLEAEYGWSYQIGLESGLADLLHLKGTLFRHETNKALSLERIPDNPNYRSAFNRGDVTRQGYELESDTVPFYNLSLKLGHAYAHTKGETVQASYSDSSFDTYSWLIGVKYDDRRSFSALLSGSYVWWDFVGDPSPRYDTFIWDLTATKKFRTSDKTTLETFLTVHNIFSGHYYTQAVYPNPGRWVEGGLRFKF